MKLDDEEVEYLGEFVRGWLVMMIGWWDGRREGVGRWMRCEVWRYEVDVDGWLEYREEDFMELDVGMM